MEDNATRNKRIAKNTMMLYFRTFITMAVGLYTGRVQLEALGIDSYGILNVVAGIIAFSGLITGTMAAASSRYITFALGEGNLDRQRTVFSTTANVQLIMGLIAVLFLEVAGVWFLNTTADIPEGRMNAANWVLQCSILSTFIGIATVPFGATIIAHEKMSLYAYMSIVEVTLKLVICFVILHYGGDRLILFSSLWLVVSVLTTLFYAVYCRIKFEEVRYRRAIHKGLLKEMAGYSGWNLLSNTTWVLNNQGISMLVNVFFGVAYNAAIGVANTVNGAIQGFVGNFTTAFSPQITKSYAAGDYQYCYSLVNRGAKFTWFMMYIFIVPVCIEAHTLLSLWLVEVPPMSTLFLQLTMFQALALQSGGTLLKLIQTNGVMKHYTISVSLYSCIVFPVVWLLYYIGTPVWTSYVVFISIYASLIFFRFKYLSILTTYNWHTYVSESLLPCIRVSVISFIIPLAISFIWPPSITRFFVLVPVSVISVFASIYFFGLNRSEKRFIIDKLIGYLSKYGLKKKAF